MPQRYLGTELVNQRWMGMDVSSIRTSGAEVHTALVGEFDVGTTRTMILNWEHIWGTTDQAVADTPIIGNFFPFVRQEWVLNGSGRGTAASSPAGIARDQSSFAQLVTYAALLQTNHEGSMNTFIQGADGGTISAVASGNTITLSQTITATTDSFMVSGYARNRTFAQANVYTGGISNPTRAQRLQSSFRIPNSVDLTQRASVARFEMAQGFFYRAALSDDLSAQEIGGTVVVRENSNFDYDQTTYFARNSGTTDFTLSDFVDDWVAYITSTTGAVVVTYRDDTNVVQEIDHTAAGISITKSGNVITIDVSGFSVPYSGADSVIVPADLASLTQLLQSTDGLFFTDSQGVDQNISLIENSITLS